MKVNHVGIITRDLEKDICLYSKMGYVLNDDIVVDNIQNNRIAIMKSNNGPNIELIEPLGESSTVYNQKDGYHHICYEPDQSEDIINSFKKIKVGKIFTAAMIAPAISNRKVVFACLQNHTFVEFVV